MGVRSALGAKGAQLIALVMRRSVVQLVIGLVLGLGWRSLASGALQPVLYHVESAGRGRFRRGRRHAGGGEPGGELPAGATRDAKIDPVKALATE